VPSQKPPSLLELAGNAANVVTTSQELADHMSPDLKAAYLCHDIAFTFLGPLLNSEEGAPCSCSMSGELPQGTQQLLANVKAAKADGLKIVLASMGTILTSSTTTGWNGRTVGPDGQPNGLTGAQLCRAAWAGVFDAFGETEALILVSVGPQRDALHGLMPPSNAICAPALPQVDILRAGVDVFLTHGGQNSFMEALEVGVPMVVNPSFTWVGITIGSTRLSWMSMAPKSQRTTTLGRCFLQCRRLAILC